VLLTQERLCERLPHQAAPLVCLDSEWEVIAQQPVEDVRSGVSPENLAYVLCPGGRLGDGAMCLGKKYRLPSSTFAYSRTGERNGSCLLTRPSHY
jgi:hypothetical protein